jgi:hypothetical protein
METSLFGKTPETKAGCCMAMTVFFFEWYWDQRGRNLLGYFKWLQTVKGISSVMNLQTKYLGWETRGLGRGLVNERTTWSTALSALRREVEDGTYKAFGFTKIDSPWFPSFPSSLAKKVMEDFTARGCVYKPIYLATTDKAHAIGAVLDYSAGRYSFFDSNHGLAQFTDPQEMKAWLEAVTDEYGEWTAFYCDTFIKQARPG